MSQGAGLLIIDASALLALGRHMRADRRAAIMRQLTEHVEDRAIGFPPAVCDDLDVIARDEAISSWAQGLGSHLDPFKPKYLHMRSVMARVQRMGYEEGFVSLEDRASSTADVMSLAEEYASESSIFTVVTDDLGEVPLSVTVEQYCKDAGFAFLDVEGCLRRSDLGRIFNGE